MIDDFSGRQGTAIVTGGSGGIGAAVCRRLAAAGSAVAFTYRSRRAEADGLARELSGGPGPVSAHRVDLTDPAATGLFVDAVAAESGGVHTVVHAAGRSCPRCTCRGYHRRRCCGSSPRTPPRSSRWCAPPCRRCGAAAGPSSP